MGVEKNVQIFQSDGKGAGRGRGAGHRQLQPKATKVKFHRGGSMGVTIVIASP